MVRILPGGSFLGGWVYPGHEATNLNVTKTLCTAMLCLDSLLPLNGGSDFLAYKQDQPGIPFILPLSIYYTGTEKPEVAFWAGV
jgi:hypothetical protein